MPDDPRVEQLLEDLLDSGGTPEEACRACPELLPQVRAGWQRLRALKAEVGALFPESPWADGATASPLPTALPRIRGHDVQGVLGRGGVGVVYKAWHLRLHRPVAVKMLLAGAYAQPEEQERFKREAETVAGLRHVNIVQVHEAGDVDGRPYFTMEFVEGGSLAQKLAGTPQPGVQAAALVATLAEAIQVAHQSGIVHRDLKPANILLTADGTPKVTDFGLARRLEDGGGLTLTGVPVGTPSYMAPEQGQGQRGSIGPATDVYALGAILYELLTGRPPFRAETATATLHQVLAEAPVPPSRLNPRVPRDLETICLKCLHKEPPRRYASAAALAEDLHRYGRGEPIVARPAGRLERLARWVRRHPAAAGLLAALAVLLVTTGVGALLLYQQQIASHIRQAQTNGEVREVLKRAQDLLEEGWLAHDLAKLTEARAEANRAVDIAHSGEANPAVRQEAEAFRKDAVGRLGRATKNNALLDAVLDVWTPQETSADVHGQAGLMLAPPSLDEQYAAAFRRWGLDVDGTAEADVIERLRQEPDVVRQELIAALDAWMLERRLPGRPEAEWRRLFRVADQLDFSARHRRLRAWLVGTSPPRAATVAGFVGTGSLWPALWELKHGNVWRGLLELRREIKPQTEPVLTVLLLARALAAVGDVVGAEEVLRQATTEQPHQVVLLDALGKLLERQGPSRLEAAIGYYRAARGQRHQLGIAMSRALLNARRATEAREVMQNLVLRQPDNPTFYNFLGIAAYEQQEEGEAETIFRKAVELKSDYAEAHYNLGVALLEQKKLDEAVAAYRQAIKIKPDFAEAHNNLGSALGQQKKLVEAEAACRKAIALKPDLAEAYNNLGTALWMQGKPAEAEAACRKAIALKPGFAEAHSNLGNALREQKKLDEAVAAYRQAIKIKPDSADVHYNLGNALLSQGKLAEAVAAYGKAIALKPDFAEAHSNLGSALRQQKKLVEAEAAFRKAIDLQSDFAHAHCNLGGALIRRQMYAEAEATLRKAIDLKPDYAEAYYNLGDALYRQKKHAAAAAAFRKAIDLQYVNAEAYNNLGMALGQQGKYAAAETAFRKAIDLQPHLAQAHINLGTALIGRQKYGEAEATLRKAIDLQPDFGPARLFLGQALMRRARFDEAVTVLTTAAELLPTQDARRMQALQLRQLCQHCVTLDARLPMMLSGKEKPANAAEKLEFAQLCFWKMHYVAAARFCREGFAAEPKLTENAPTDIRYLAACAASLAGCGLGKDADKLDDKERAGWRKQALDWLRQDLTGWGKALDNSNAQTNARVQLHLRQWQADASLVGVRGKGALARLPDEERKQWEGLWSDLDALLRRMSQPE